MPKTPILNREAFYETLGDGTIRFLDFCLVDTSLGTMVEPRATSLISMGQSIAAVSVYDGSISKLSPMQSDEFYKLTGFSGRQMPINSNR
jgi:hypothetical protein